MNDFPLEWRDLDVVLCHDWLTGMRGGERVLELLGRAFPSARIFTLFHNPQAVSQAINQHPITTSWLQRLPGILRHYRHLLPLFPNAIEHLRLPPCRLVISTSHCVAKGVRPPPGARHLCYCFTPMRYAWLFQDAYFAGHPLRRRLAAPLLAWLRRWDRTASARVHRFVAISRHVRDRIRAFYGRDADVVYPPVDLERWTPGSAISGGYDLVVSALVPYKRVDLAIAAAVKVGFPLKIVGVGTELRRLRALASANVEFLGWQSDEAVRELYRGCRALLFPGEEDLGLVPLEAQACGRPVVAFARGGALETVREGVTGVFFHEQTVDALTAALHECARRTWDPGLIRQHAEQFGPGQFISGLQRILAEMLAEPPPL